MPERTHAWPVYDIFDTADGQKIFIAVVTDGHWKSFCETYDLNEFLTDARLKTATDRIEARSWTIPKVAEKVCLYEAGELETKLDALSIPFAKINSPEDLFNDPHVQREGGLVNFENSDGRIYRTPTLPLELDGAGLGEGMHVPALGADTEDILRELGMA
jgi:crotonobetainyl-CoA:carnitine CoA-transferase CaiB-like acyl-CoA transferase